MIRDLCEFKVLVSCVCHRPHLWLAAPVLTGTRLGVSQFPDQGQPAAPRSTLQLCEKLRPALMGPRGIA